jgi:hypothetical protein
MASSPDKLPDIIPEPIKKIKSPVIRGGFGTIATPANNIGGDSAWKYRRVRNYPLSFHLSSLL